MEAEKDNPFDFGKMNDDWMQSVTDLWACVLDQSSSGDETTSKEDKETVSQLFLRLNEISLDGFSMLSKEITDCFEQMNASLEEGEFQEMSGGLYRIWNEMYEKKFSRIFQLPKLGLMSGHQEKASRMMDKYNRLQASLSELLRLLGQPFRHCQKKMTVKMAKMVKKGITPKDTKDCYKEWVSELEAHFMSLFQNPKYISVLSLTLSALSDYIAVRDEAMEDLLAMFPVARKTDMDDMARELYELKRRLGKLEKRVRPEIVCKAV
jgi:hypothetical protein